MTSVVDLYGCIPFLTSLASVWSLLRYWWKHPETSRDFAGKRLQKEVATQTYLVDTSAAAIDAQTQTYLVVTSMAAVGQRNVETHSDDAPTEFALGDIIRFRADAKFRGRSAIITEVQQANCVATVLDESSRFAVDERWPNYEDIEIDSRKLRLGSRVIVDGLQGGSTRKLNGLRGCIASHSRESHPAFISNSTSPEQRQLAVLVQFEDPRKAGRPSLFLEPRFLHAHDEVASSI